ncbi:MAG: SDR family NAD(P)-dependent oxidoreductase [Ruminococcus sp.]|jgi:3-oxoacyl-[acyl-carrier protein] reductase
MKTNRMSLKGQTAIVTGGGSGIGRAISAALAVHGAFLLISGRNTDRLKETVEQIRHAGGYADYIQADVAIAADVDAMMKKAEDLYGHIDLLYNNAGLCTICDIENMPENCWDDTFSVNCKGVFLCSRAAIPFMKKTGRGRIINIASQTGKNASPWQSAIPLGRWVTPQDVADTAVLLASDYTDYMTGQAINISGGQTMI